MSKVKILSVEQTEKAGLFTICFENENFSEFEKFIQKFKDNAECKRDFQIILSALRRMLETSGFLESVIRNFVPPKFRNLKPPEIGKVK